MRPRTLHYCGVHYLVMDMGYVCAPKNCYVLYHSMYEVPWTVEHLMDAGFHVHTAMGRVVLETARALAGGCARGRTHTHEQTR